uniref:Alpha-2-macroglobulin n=1 Tax=Naja naja TaxID=35670 RepID=A0A8C7E170_NAJNA
IALFTVEVTGATLSYFSRKRVYIDNLDRLLFVQTDKPIYKPGQNGKSMVLGREQLSETECILACPPFSFLPFKKFQLYPDTSFFLVVLPKFEVVVKSPKVVTILDKELEVTACGKYTYGKPVPGLVSIRVCRKFSIFRSTCYGEESKAICEEFSGEADIHGCFSQVVDLKIFQLKRNGLQMEISMEGAVTEEGTEVVLTGSGTTQITSSISDVSFEKVDAYYKPGLPLSGELKLVDGRKKPIANETIELQISGVQNSSFYKTDAEGRAHFSIETSDFTSDAIQLTAIYEKLTNSSRFHSPSQSYLKIEALPGTLKCGQHAVIPVHYILNSEVIKDKEVVFHYLVVSRGDIVKSGTHPLKEKHNKGTFNLDLLVDIKIAPLARLLLYTILDNGELVVHSADFPVEPCFANKVDLRFAEREGLPGSSINLHLAAAQNSLCAIHAVDESVFLLKPEAELSPRTVSDLLDTCGKERGQTYLMNFSLSDIAFGPTRQWWLYVEDYLYCLGKFILPSASLASLSSETELTVPVTIPDTITDWRAGAFCLSPAVGFGLAQTTFLKAIQPFFVEVTQPYSVIRGEAYVLKATVYNYQKHSIQVSVSLLLSPDYDASPVDQEQASYCLPVDGRKTVSWKVTPKTLGEVNFTITAEALKSTQLCGNEIPEVPAKGQRDIVIKTLLVEWIVDSQLLTSFISLLPATGDILGSAIQNVHQLLQLPTGCGEQNIALLAPNIYIMDYLNKTDQLTEETKSKAIGYLVAGYQRQLNYKHDDGSYSTFGQRNNQPGNVWLTAFVLKCFSQMKRYILVEAQHLYNAEVFLALRQNADGCFQAGGTLLNNALQGGVDNEIALSVYIAISLLEIPLPVTHFMVRNALFCLETASQRKDLPTYTQALLAYAFALANKEDKVAEILQSLQEKAVKGDDGSIHWERPVKPETSQSYYYEPRAPPAEVEMSSYVLLAYLTRASTPSQDDLAMATKIVTWLIKQQNPFGGFSSTQDTVVALQALTLYAGFTFAKTTASTTVTLKSGGNNLREFHVDNTNRLLLQCQALPNVPGEYTPVVTGENCIYLQTTLRYNVLPHPEAAPFELIVSTIPDTCVGVKAHKEFDIAVNVSYTGHRPASNMAILKIKIVSGFSPNKPSVKKVMDNFYINLFFFFFFFKKALISPD